MLLKYSQFSFDGHLAKMDTQTCVPAFLYYFS